MTFFPSIQTESLLGVVKRKRTYVSRDQLSQVFVRVLDRFPLFTLRPSLDNGIFNNISFASRCFNRRNFPEYTDRLRLLRVKELNIDLCRNPFIYLNLIYQLAIHIRQKIILIPITEEAQF